MLVRFNRRTIVGGTIYEKDSEEDLANDLSDQVVRDGNGEVVGLGALSNEVSWQRDASGATVIVGPDGSELNYEPLIGYTLPNNIIEITASKIVVGKSAKLHKISCISATAIDMTIYDNQTAVAGTSMWTQTYNTGDTVSFPGGMLLINGIYAAFTGTATFQIEVSDAG